MSITVGLLDFHLLLESALPVLAGNDQGIDAIATSVYLAYDITPDGIIGRMIRYARWHGRFDEILFGPCVVERGSGRYTAVRVFN